MTSQQQAGISPVLRLDGISITFPGSPPVVNDVSLVIRPGERVALVGESGSGKTLTALAAVNALPEPARLTSGQVHLDRRGGSPPGFVMQEASSALNPVLSVGAMIRECLPDNRRGRLATQAAAELLTRVGLEHADDLVRAYPHQLSGGQAQRVMIAIALAGRPALIIADEPTTGLDLVTQAQVLDLLRQVSDEDDLALLLISHELSIVADLVHRVVVLYAGQVVEVAPAEQIFDRPLHPYTRHLLACRLGSHTPPKPLPRGHGISKAATGCRFQPRCEMAEADCSSKTPGLLVAESGCRVRCPVVLSTRAAP